MPKILKLKKVSKENVSKLTCRGVKSSMNDPVKLIQKVLDKVYKPFTTWYYELSPSVTGIEEAIQRIRKSKIGKWGKSIELEGDFGDLYSNCNTELLEKCLMKAGKIAKLEPTSIHYILNLMKVSMQRHSYFKEPEGILKTCFQWGITQLQDEVR